VWDDDFCKLTTEKLFLRKRERERERERERNRYKE
jgi:hypothetical protein